jgi:hypothetical protein
MIYKFCCLVFLLISACVDNNINQSENNSHLDSMKKEHISLGNRNTLTHNSKSFQSGKDSILLKGYDYYEFENDTLLQSGYIHYLAPRKIKFFVRTRNKISTNMCEFSDIARMADGEGTAQGNDGLNNDELYGEYEYFTNKYPFFTIGVEFKRGKRMTIYLNADTPLCKVDCPLSSKGTLRRKMLSTEVQHNPTW